VYHCHTNNNGGTMTTDQKLAAIMRHYTNEGDRLPAIADRIGVSHVTLRRWLSGDRDPDTMADSVRKIDRAWEALP
jgi:transposase-like protein